MMPPSAKRANPSSLGTCFHYRCRHGMSLPAVLDKCPETSASERLPWKASPSFGVGWKRVLCKRKARLQPTQGYYHESMTVQKLRQKVWDRFAREAYK